MRALFLLPALLAPLPAMAQQVDEQLWLSANGAVALGAKTTLTLESIARFGDRAGGLADAQFGGNLAFALPHGAEVLIGYRHVQDYDHGAARPAEERTRIQVKLPLGAGFSGALRFEQRFFAAGGEVGLRLRPSLRYSLPLGGNGFALFAAHEDFINLGARAGQTAGYERMRNSAGVTIPLSGRLKGELSYLNQYRFGRGGARDQMDHAATFALTLSL